jgi:estrogen-related receptor beta like 1
MPVMEATVDPAEWRIELERVAPLLRFAANPHATKEWRAHLEQSVRHDKELKEGLPAVRTQLQKLGRHLRKSVERIEQKEEHINKEFDHLGADFRAQQQQLDAAQTRYNALSASVSELTSDLSSKADAVEMLKSQMTDRNDSMTDTSPLRRITAALSGLQAEVEAMELRIGVVGQTLLQSKVKSGKSTRVHGRHVGGMSIGAGDDGRERKGRRQR